MLPEHLKEHAAAVAVEAFDADAVKGGKFEFGELTLEIAPAKIVSVCGFLKYDQKFVRLSRSPRSTAIRPSRASKSSIICTRSSATSGCA